MDDQAKRWAAATDAERSQLLEVYRWVMESIGPEAAVRYARRFGILTEPPAMLPPASPAAVAQLLDAGADEAELDGAHRMVSEAIIDGARKGLPPASIAGLLQELADLSEALTIKRAHRARSQR